MEIAIPPAPKAFGAPDDPRSVARAMAPPSRFGDKAFEWLTLTMALAVVLLVILTGWQLWRGFSLAIQKFGFHFSRDIHLGPGRGAIWRAPVYLRNAGFFLDCAAHRRPIEHRDCGLSDGTCAALASPATRFLD